MTPDEINAERFTAWFGEQWGDRAPATWNVRWTPPLGAAYWGEQGWIAADPRGCCGAAAAAGPFPGAVPGRRGAAAHP